MATYCISDIHGALDEFRRLLNKVGFRYDGTDELYILGDIGDWGTRSMETILHVKAMEELYPFVHVLMGNHELMFLDAISHAGQGLIPDDTDYNWLYPNHGEGTWKSFCELPLEEQVDLYQWILVRPYSWDIRIGDRLYMAAHAYSYYYDQEAADSEERRRKQCDTVWRRLLIREDPFAEYTGEKHYDTLICGHTITDFYYTRLRYERNWPYRKPGEYVRNRAFFAERFIDIDCGAKCIEMAQDRRELLQTAALRAQLCALRLEDMKTFYCRKSQIRLPDSQELQESLQYSEDAIIEVYRQQEMRMNEIRESFRSFFRRWRER